MNYNKKLEELINQAKSDGFKFENGEFIDTKSNYVKVLNVRAGTLGSGESNGDMEIFDKLYILSDENYNQLVTLKESIKQDKIVEFICDIVDSYKDEDWINCSCVETMVNCYDNLYIMEEKDALEQCSVNYECHLRVSLFYIDEYFMDVQVLYIPTDVYTKHKQIYVYTYPINRNC